MSWLMKIRNKKLTTNTVLVDLCLCVSKIEVGRSSMKRNMQIVTGVSTTKLYLLQTVHFSTGDPS